MPFITFMYRIGNKKFFGKYVCDYISDDHEGLDGIIKSIVINGLNEYRKQKGLSKLEKRFKLGVLSFSDHQYIPTYSNDEEIQCFDFYYKYFNFEGQTYINGKLIKF